MDEKQRIVLGGVIIIFVIFVAFSFQSNISPYTSVSEVIQKEEMRGAQVNGTIVQNSTKYYQNNNTRIFEVTDGKSKMKVKYTGTLSSYQEGISAVVIGDYSDGMFHANKVLLKCPSKYESRGEKHPSNVEIDN